MEKKKKKRNGKKQFKIINVTNMCRYSSFQTAISVYTIKDRKKERKKAGLRTHTLTHFFCYLKFVCFSIKVSTKFVASRFLVSRENKKKKKTNKTLHFHHVFFRVHSVENIVPSHDTNKEITAWLWWWSQVNLYDTRPKLDQVPVPISHDGGGGGDGGGDSKRVQFHIVYNHWNSFVIIGRQAKLDRVDQIVL